MYSRTLIRELATMDRQMGRIMRSVSMMTCLAGATVDRGVWVPPANLGESAAEVVLMMEVAGVRPEDVSVILEPRTVTVSGVRNLPDIAVSSLHRIEIEQGRFRRVVALPCPVDVNGSGYACDNGILIVRMPKLRPGP